MRDDGPYMPKLNWEQDKDAEHIYDCKVDGKYACRIKRRYRAEMEKVWDWSIFPYNFNRRMPKDAKDQGHELTARLAVMRAEEAFAILMEQPVYKNNSVINVPDSPPSQRRRR